MMKKRKKSDNYEMRPIDRIINGAFYLLLGFILLFCALLFFSTKSHCAEITSHNLPFTESSITTYNTFFVDHNELWFQRVLSHYDVENIENCAIFIFESSENSSSVFVRLCLITQEDVNNFVAYNSSNEIINISEFNDYTSDYFVLPTTKNTYTWRYRKDNSDFYLYSSTPNRNSNLSFFGNHNMNSYGMTFCYPVYIKGTLSIGNNIIITSIPNFIHNQGHAIPPDTFEIPIYTTGHTPPTNVPPTYTINNYTWTTYTPPTIDTSNAETLLESIYNAIVYNGQYLKDNIHGELTNLVDNIGGFFEFIGDTIQYYGNLIISNIQNGITTFYNNMVSLFEPIPVALDYISQPLDMDNLTTAVNSTTIWGDVDTCTTFANDAFGIYGTVAEPNTFKIPLDLRSISLLNITQVYYIDLSWLDGAKTAIRAFMWCVVTFGLLYSVIVDIPNMIRSSK